MVELPHHRGGRSWFRRALHAFRQWLERDLNETKPLSLALAIVPVLPAILADELGAAGVVTDVLFSLGGALAVGWFGYILVRFIAVSTRNIKRNFSDVDARKRGEELPTRCPECGAELPDFDPPKDGHVYRFQGWDCENCGTALDALGHQI